MKSILCVLLVCCGLCFCGCSEGNSRQSLSGETESVKTSGFDSNEKKEKGCGGSCCSSITEKVALVCNMTDEDLRQHKATVIASLRSQVLAKKELDNGYAFKFSSNEKTLEEVNEFIKTESQCCEFFTFDLSVNESSKEAWLSMTGPEGVKEFITAELEM